MKNEDVIKIENLRHREGNYVIRWNVTRVCNYQCDFCIQGDKEKHLKDSANESENIRTEICDSLRTFIDNELKEFKKVDFFLIGGEITLLRDLPEILEKISNSSFEGVINFHLTSNLSCNIKYLEKLKNVFKDKNNRNLYIAASFYKQFTNEKEFMEKVKFLYSGNKINTLVEKIRFPRIKRILKKIFKKVSNIHISIGYPLIEDKDYRDYLKFSFKNFKHCNSMNYIVIRNYKKSISDKLSKKLSKINAKKVRVTLRDGSVKYFTNTAKLGLALTDSYVFNPKGFLCDAGALGINISNNGDVSRCVSCAKKTFICNIRNEEMHLIKDKFICDNERCVCDYYTIIERE